MERKGNEQISVSDEMKPIPRFCYCTLEKI